jgi:transcriptional regulator with XRE-family HTH domain
MMQTSLGHRLRVLRAERGLTLREAASETGVAKETISDIERGIRHPHDVTLSKLARGYGVPVEDLLPEPVPLDEAPPPLLLAAMYREEDENVRRRALEAASDDEIERYVNSINEQVEWAEKTQRSPEGQGAGNREGLRLYIHHLLTLRDEVKPSDTPPFEEMAALAYAGAES